MGSPLKLAAVLVTILVVFVDLSSTKLIIRTKRQSGREGQPASEVVVISDQTATDSTNPSNTRYDISGGDGKRKPFAAADEEVDLKVNEDDGRFTFGGRLPDFHHFHGQFSQLFDVLSRHFDDMSKRFDDNFSAFSATDITKLPANYNNTETELVTMEDGKRFIKKKTTVKKGGPHTQIFITSTTYEPVPDESVNIEPGSETGHSESPVTSGSGSTTSGKPGGEGIEREDA